MVSLKEQKKYAETVEKQNDYNKKHCWQFDIRVKNYDRDLEEAGLTKDYVEALRVPNFRFENIADENLKKDMVSFIKRHEWLGTISQMTTHWFGCYLDVKNVKGSNELFASNKSILAGVILMNLPNSLSNLLGKEQVNLERLISRGACISWSPKNLASSFLMWCINWMVQNTDYRVFSAYSDPSAKELGTIYQACNFFYIGNKFGDGKRYLNPYNKKIVSSRFFRQVAAYKKYAEEQRIYWRKNWNESRVMKWENIPPKIEKVLRKMSVEKMKECEHSNTAMKHKYVYVLGRDKKETKILRRKFLEINKTYPYPKDRGK